MKAFVHPTAVIGEFVTLEDDVYIGPLCVIGYPAEWKGKEHNDRGVIIMRGARLTGLVTVDSGVERPTIVGENCYIMKHAHIGHDALINAEAIISCGAKIGGHAEIGVYTNIGLNACVHQRVIVPQSCMVGMGAVVTKKTVMAPFCKYAGVPAKYIGGN